MIGEGYGICPNGILFDTNVSDKQLRLFIYISSLTAESGVCFASNEHLAEKFGCGKQTISNNVKALEKLSYVFIDYEYKGSKVSKRLIRIEESKITPSQDDIQSLFNYWNECEILISHKNLDRDTKSTIRSALKKYPEIEIRRAIYRYMKVLESENGYTYKWTISEFMTRKNALKPFIEKKIEDFIRTPNGNFRTPRNALVKDADYTQV